MKIRDTKQGHIWILALILVMVLSVSTVSIAQVAPSMESAKIEIRGGVGTDISGRLAYGIGGNYLIDLQSNALESGILFFSCSFEEESTEGIHICKEKTDTFVFGMMANYLINYSPGKPRLFFVAGIGLGSIKNLFEKSFRVESCVSKPSFFFKTRFLSRTILQGAQYAPYKSYFSNRF